MLSVRLRVRADRIFWRAITQPEHFRPTTIQGLDVPHCSAIDISAANVQAANNPRVKRMTWRWRLTGVTRRRKRNMAAFERPSTKANSKLLLYNS